MKNSFGLGINRSMLQTMIFAVLLLVAISHMTVSASAQTRSLKLYYLHTGEKATITYKKNGKYSAAGLKKINWFLRDWRRNEPTKMNPLLLDLIWETYRQSGSKKHIHVISGYRSPASNKLLRKRSKGVAKNSQHTRGNALDFFLPDVKLAKMRKIGLKLGSGGVGYYPTSGSPFIHLDVGSVRHWPRMTRKQLVKIFPSGKTMHVPTDGKPLSGYNTALASYKKRKSKGTLVPNSKLGSNDLNFFQKLAALTKADQAEDEQANTTPAPRVVTTTKKPIIETPEQPQYAALPNIIPVPELAPRNIQLASGSSIELTTEEPFPVIEDEAPELVQEPEQDTLLASMPVPAKRPEGDQSSLLALREEEPQIEIPSDIDINTKQEPADQGVQIAALSPSEIEDLRSTFKTLADPEQKTSGPIPAVEVGDPEPSVSEPVVVNTPEIESPPVTEPVQQIVENEQILTETPETDSKPVEIELASIETKELAPIPLEPETKSTGLIPLPEKNPAIVEIPEAEVITTIATAEPLEPIEPGTISTGEFATPSQNPKIAENLLALAESEKVAQEQEAETVLAAIEKIESQPTEETTPVDELLASLPIPSPNPLREVQLASLEAPVIKEPNAIEQIIEENPSQEQALVQRTISLDELSAPQTNTTTIGKWALASNVTIRDFANVQAPAYGRNMIRKLPNTIVIQRFDGSSYAPGLNSFSGKAVNAVKFAKL